MWRIAAAPLAPAVDGRQSERALAVARGATRLLSALDFAVLPELPLPSGRRADLTALGRGGTVWIVEVKSCLDDFRTDRKWAEYRLHADRLLFAVAPDFPMAVLPEEAGLIVADAHGGELVREGGLNAIPAATRKVMMLRFARAAAARLALLHDPAARLLDEI